MARYKEAPYGWVQEVIDGGGLAADAVVFPSEAEARRGARVMWGHEGGLVFRPATRAEYEDYQRRKADDERIFAKYRFARVRP